MQCEQINQRRQQLCEQIEQEAIAHFEQSQIDLQQSAYWSLSNRTGITVSLALLPPAWWIAMAFPCSSEPMKMSNTFVAQRGHSRISCI